MRVRQDVEREIGEAVNRLVEQGSIRPVVGARFPLERARRRAGLVESRGALGKVVLDVR